MAAKRPVLAVAVATTVVAIGFLAFQGTRPDGPVVARAEGRSPVVPEAGGEGGVPEGENGVDPTLVSAGRPSPDAPRPGAIAAIVGSSVVLLDGRDGHTVRTLATHAEAATGGFPYLEGVAFTPDRNSVFYALADDCGPATIYRVAADGRAPSEAILSGVSPAVSPDGRKLAYAVAGSGAPPAAAPASGGSPSEDVAPADRHCQNAVVVRDLHTGMERTWRYPDTPDFATSLYQQAVITEISWAPDSTITMASSVPATSRLSLLLVRSSFELGFMTT